MVSDFPKHKKRGGHFSTIAEFWEHSAQADFIMVHGNLIRIGGIRRTDVMQPKGSQFKWIGRQYSALGRKRLSIKYSKGDML